MINKILDDYMLVYKTLVKNPYSKLDKKNNRIKNQDLERLKGLYDNVNVSDRCTFSIVNSSDHISKQIYRLMNIILNLESLDNNILKYSNDNSELCKSSNNFLDSYRILLTGMSTNFLPDNIFYKIKSISDYYSKVLTIIVDLILNDGNMLFYTKLIEFNKNYLVGIFESIKTHLNKNTNLVINANTDANIGIYLYLDDNTMPLLFKYEMNVCSKLVNNSFSKNNIEVHSYFKLQLYDPTLMIIDNYDNPKYIGISGYFNVKNGKYTEKITGFNDINGYYDINSFLAKCLEFSKQIIDKDIKIILNQGGNSDVDNKIESWSFTPNNIVTQKVQEFNPEYDITIVLNNFYLEDITPILKTKFGEDYNLENNAKILNILLKIAICIDIDRNVHKNIRGINECDIQNSSSLYLTNLLKSIHNSNNGVIISHREDINRIGKYINYISGWDGNSDSDIFFFTKTSVQKRAFLHEFISQYEEMPIKIKKTTKTRIGYYLMILLELISYTPYCKNTNLKIFGSENYYIKLYNNLPNGLFKRNIIKPPSNEDLILSLENNLRGPILKNKDKLISQYIYLFINNIIHSFSL